MLRHVLCVLALALCCCTSLCVAAVASGAVGDGAPEGTVKFPLVTGDAKITLTETVDDSSCTVPQDQTGNSNDRTISTTVTLKKDGSQETKEIKKEPLKIVKVPLGHGLMLETSLIVECTKQGEADAAITKTNCTAEDSEAATGSITYVATAADSTAGGITTTNKQEVKVPVGFDVSIIEKVVVKCKPFSAAEPHVLPTTAKIPAEPHGKSHTDQDAEETSIPPEGPPPEHKPLTTLTDNRETHGRQTRQEVGTTAPDPTTIRKGSASPAADRKQSSALNNDVATPSFSEAESTETDNSVTVSDADHTAPTTTPQSETTTEGAPKTDAGMSTSAGEGVKLPDRNTDASSSS
ncbi:hypothetical protein DQ04_14591000, partial [Trypanosoma grayi]|uniref:hypothetical protein n=1 Tax=Trypanosoma grayi TaxID=71804 RepID=UPI0004F3F301